MNILQYYKFSNPPFLEISPLQSDKELLTYFSGRTKELNDLRGLDSWGGKYAALLTGRDGVGKTTLMRRFLQDCPVSCYTKGDELEDLRVLNDASAELNSKGRSEQNAGIPHI